MGRFCLVPRVSRLAAIDLGTNTVRLLVVETRGAGRWRTLAQDQLITRLGEGAAASGLLGDTPIERTVATVAAFCRQAEALGASEVMIVATSAVREAVNRQALLDRVRAASGHEVRVVTGEEEARLALLGALSEIRESSGEVLLVDIGGGSTEFTLARERRVVAALSIRLGVVPLAERYMTQGPVDWARYGEMDREVRAELAPALSRVLPEHRPDLFIGTAGTVTTLAALDQALSQYDPERVQGYRLHRHRIEKLLAALGALPVAARAALPCLDPGRADLIIPGISICLAAMDCCGFDSLLVSEYALREGILIDYLGRSAAS